MPTTLSSDAVLTLETLDQIVTDAVVEQYWERGYWCSPKVLSDAQIETLRAQFQRLWTGDYDYDVPWYEVKPKDLTSSKLRKQNNAFWMNRVIRETVTSPILGAIASRLMRAPSVRLWHDQAIDKPGSKNEAAGGNVGWHQDYGFWRVSDTTNMVTAWVALQDTHLENGGMRTIVGSHRWGVVENSNTFHDQDLEGLKERYAAQGNTEWIDEPCILRAGEVSFHHALTFHGSGPNLTDQDRLSVVAHLMPGGTAYQRHPQWHPNMVMLGPNASPGQPFEGDAFPQLWPPLER